MEELWKDIAGYEDLFQISNLGRVFSKRTNKILKNSKSGKYKGLSTRVNGKAICLKIHRLVAIAFIENPDNKPEVNHIDGNKHNNVESNLEWVTESENRKHAVESGLIRTGEKSKENIQELIDEISNYYIKHKSTRRELKERFNVTDHFINRYVYKREKSGYIRRG